MISTGEFCNREVIVCEPTETVQTAAQLMRDRHVGSIVVVERRDDQPFPVGMITDRDIVVGLVAEGVASPGGRPVSDVMTAMAVCATEAESLLETLQRMRSFGVRRMPVTDARGVLVGMVAYDDLIEFVSDELDELAELLTRERRREVGPPTSHAW